jgi:phage portal protein BeeE
MWYHFDSMKWLNAIKSFFSPGKKGAEGMSLWPMYGAGALFSTRTMGQDKLMDQALGWVYACISRIGDDVGNARMRLYRRKGKGPEDWEEIEDHPILDILDRPNATQPQ